MPVDKRAVIEFLQSQADRPLKAKDIARALDIEAREYGRFKELLREMEDAGTLYRVRKGRYALPTRINLVVGRLQTTRAGHGFVLTEGGGPDVFIAASRLGSAYDGDRVVARVERRRRGANPEGTVVKVLERARTQVVGLFRRAGRYSSVSPEDRKLHRDVFVPSGADGGAADGQVVVARILEWGSDHQDPIGEVVEVLGDPAAAGVDVLAIVRDRELPDEFPAEVLREAEEIAASSRLERELERREDFRGLLAFTIDPEDAKDHDDALSIERLGDNRVRVGVHIADVSHYVSEGLAIDLEAFQRGTSTYLVDRVLPMLPEVLSSDLCSLKPDVDRLTLSVLLELDAAGELLSVDFAAGVIRSRHKLSYEEAQEIIDSGKSDRALRRPLRQLRDLAARLRERRQRRGGLDFDLPEARVVLNAAGEPTQVQRRLRLESHQLIEEFMLLANESVARLARRRRWPFIYRVHEHPDPDRIERLRDFLAELGLQLRKNAYRSPKGLQKVLRAVDRQPEEALVSMLVLRSLKQARYSVEREGHFGLAANAYTHFTSPIRRYPDLVVHRLLRSAVLEGQKITESLTERLRMVAEHASARERRAMEAERDSVELKQIEFMERHLGDVFSGTISGVASYGIFVLLDEVLVEGLLHVSMLDDDYYHFVEDDYALVGEAHGRRLRLGDRIDVQVVSVDRSAREVDLGPIR